MQLPGSAHHPADPPPRQRLVNRPRALATACACAALFATAAGAQAAQAYIAIGDSITFGETNLAYLPSFGDRGYVGRYADVLASKFGQRPEVINLAIDGETASSFMTGMGRTPPVVGRGDVPLALQNLNYSVPGLKTQSATFAAAVANQQAKGNTVGTVTMTLGFNEVAALSALPLNTALARVPQTLADYRDNASEVLTQVRDLLPQADLALLGYYNPFPADPGSPAAPIFNVAGAELNQIIQQLAGQFGATYVDTGSAFVGHEAQLTWLDEQPAGATISGPFGGVMPIGNVHPNDFGYDIIAAQVVAATAVSPIPEPSTWLMWLGGGAILLGALRRRSQPVRMKAR